MLKIYILFSLFIFILTNYTLVYDNVKSYINYSYLILEYKNDPNLIPRRHTLHNQTITSTTYSSFYYAITGQLSNISTSYVQIFNLKTGKEISKFLVNKYPTNTTG